MTLLSASVHAITLQPTSVKIKDLVATFIDKFYLSLCLLETENKALTRRTAAAPHEVKLKVNVAWAKFILRHYRTMPIQYFNHHLIFQWHTIDGQLLTLETLNCHWFRIVTAFLLIPTSYAITLCFLICTVWKPDKVFACDPILEWTLNLVIPGTLCLCVLTLIKL